MPAPILLDVACHATEHPADELGVLESPECKRTLGLLLALDGCVLDERIRRRGFRRAEKLGLPTTSDLVSSVEPQLVVAIRLKEFGSAIAAAADPNSVLGAWSAGISALVQGKTESVRRDIGQLVLEALPPLLERAFARDRRWYRLLRGKTTAHKDGTLRLEYDWSDKKQLADWLPVLPRRGRFFQDSPGVNFRRVRREVDPARGMLQIWGRGYFRHRVQFACDIQVEIRPCIDEKPGTGGTRLEWIYPGRSLVCAHRPSSYIVAAPYDPAALLAAWQGGERRKLDGLDKELFDKMKEPVIHNKAELSILRKGDWAEFRVAGTSFAKVDCSSMPSRGAVIFVQPSARARKSDPKKPSLAVGKVVIQGRPHPKGYRFA